MMMNQRENDFMYSGTLPNTKEFSDGLRQYMMKIYNTMTIGLVITGLTSYAVANSPAISFFMQPSATWILLLGMLAFILIGFNPKRIWRSSTAAMKLTFYGFSAFLGAFYSTYVVLYTGESLARVFFVTAATFLAMSLWGYTTKKDLSSMGSFLMMGVFGLIIAMVVNIFLQSPMLHFIYSAAGVVIYTLLTAFDTQNLKRTYLANHGQGIEDKMAVFGALSLYLNFVLLFQFLMNFMGQR